MRGDKGTGLATVLLVMAVLASIALTLASSTTFHLRLANRQSQGEQSRNLAESVLTRAKDILVDQPYFGGEGTTSEDDSVGVQFSPDTPTGKLTFDPPTAQAWGFPVSVNNLEKDTSIILADGRTLPPFSAYLVAYADCGGVPKILETVITIPYYKYALATSGTITSDGRLLVASVDKETDLSGGLDAVPDDKLLPGHIAALGTDLSVFDSVNEANKSLITGDVISGGTVTVGPFTNVKGSVKQHHEPEDLPEITVTDYDPEGWAGLETINSASIASSNPTDPMTLEGLWKRRGDLQVLGPLKLDGCYLYVDGDFHVQGAISGKGSIFCTGAITVDGASGFATDNVQAMVADGAITIKGGASVASRNTSFFNGILFSHGGMNLSNVTVVGSVVNNSPEATVLELNNVSLLSNPTTVSVDFGLPGQPTIAVLQNLQSELEYVIRPTSEDFLRFFSPDDNQYSTPDPTEIPLSIFQTLDLSPIKLDLQPHFGPFTLASEIYNFLIGRHGESLDASDQQTLREAIAQADFQFRSDFLRTLANANELYAQSHHESMRKGKFTMDPNQFVPFADRVKVVWSKEIPVP